MGSDTEDTCRTAFPGWVLCVCMETNKIRQNVVSQPSDLCSQACLENVVCLECIQALDRGRLLKVLSGQLSFA